MQKLIGGFLLAALVMPSITSAASPSFETQLNKLNALVAFLEDATGYVDPEPLNAAEMRDIIMGGTTFLQNAQEDSGHFRYEYAPYEDHYLPGDNIVRQAGALFELGEVARRAPGKVDGLDANIEAAIAYFEELSKEDEVEGIEFRCIVEHEDSRRCKLGATALALIGILGYVEAHPERAAVYDALINDYIAYIEASELEDGGFRYIHRVGRSAQSDRQSSFSNGEALLALVRYYQYEPREELKTMARDTFTHLKDTEFDSALYLWIMAALKDMQELWPDPAYAQYAEEYSDWRIAGVSRYKHTKHNYCAYTEGVVSAYSVLEGTQSPAELLALRREIDYWNQKNARLQIGSGDRYRYMLEDGELQLHEVEDMEQASGGFLTGTDELTQRIDFTQHCISAYLQVLVDIDGETL